MKIVEVFAGELWQATMIQNILEGNQIQAFINNALMGTIEPWVITAGGYKPVKVIVAEQDVELALKLIDEFNQSQPADEAEE